MNSPQFWSIAATLLAFAFGFHSSAIAQESRPPASEPAQSSTPNDRKDRPQDRDPGHQPDRNNPGPEDRKTGPGEIQQPGQDRRATEARNRRLEQLRERLRDVEAAGKQDEAEELRNQIGKLERSMNNGRPGGNGPGFNRGGGRNDDAFRPAGGRDGGPRNARRNDGERNGNSGPGLRGPGMPGNRGSQQERLEHLEQSIHHLRAAGMPELAERVAQTARKLKEESFRNNGPDNRRGRGPGQPDSEVHAQLREMQRQIEEIRRNLAEQRRDAR